MRVRVEERTRSEHEDAADRPSPSTGGYARLVRVARSPWFPWAIVGLMTVALATTWWPTFSLPFGDGRDGGLLGSEALRVRNFWEKGFLGSSFVSDTGPYMGNYAHHPPMPNFLYAAASAVVGQGEPQIRLTAYLLGLATIPGMALLMRALRVQWIAVFLALGLMMATDFFWVYARVARGFAPVAFLAVAIVYLRQREEPPNWSVWGTAALGAFAAMWSWVACAIAAGLGLWLFASRRLDRITVIVGVGMATGFLITVLWVLGISGVDSMASQAEFRTGGDFTWPEFFRRQRTFAEGLLPNWYIFLLGPALVAGLWHRGTRVVVAVTLLVTVAWAIGMRNGAYIHDYWNGWLLFPGAVGMAALFDLSRRVLQPRIARPIAGVALALVGLAFIGVVNGPAEARYFGNPADAGSLVRDNEPAPGQHVAWFVGGISSPRWFSWYWDLPARKLHPDNLSKVSDNALVLVRVDRMPTWLPADVDEQFFDARGQYALVRAGSLRPSEGSDVDQQAS